MNKRKLDGAADESSADYRIAEIFGRLEIFEIFSVGGNVLHK